MISVPYEVKKALRDGMLRKNYRFLVLNDDGTTDFTIDNDTLVSESVGIDERMCSGDTLKFGLCEGSSLEFQYFNHPNIYGRRIQVFIDMLHNPPIWSYETSMTAVDRYDRPTYDLVKEGLYRFIIPANTPPMRIYWNNGASTKMRKVATSTKVQVEEVGVLPVGGFVRISWEDATSGVCSATVEYGERYIGNPIPMGFFDVKKCSRQASTGIMKVTAYNKLMSEYLDAKANDIINTIPADDLDGTTSIYTILRYTLNDYGIIEKPKEVIPFIAEGSIGGRAYDAINMRIIGYSNTYHPSIHTSEECSLYTEHYSTENMVSFGDLSSYIQLLTNAVDSMKTAFYSKVQNADTVWNNIKAAGFDLCGIEIEIQVPIGVSVPLLIYTLPELVVASPSPRITYRSIYELKDIKNVSEIRITIPHGFKGYRSISSTQEEVINIWTGTDAIPQGMFDDIVSIMPATEFGDAEWLSVNVEDLPDVTLRELQSAVYETLCQFGQLSRTTDLFEGVELNNGGLYPSDTLYPADDLYPSGASLSATKAMYSQLWADEGNRRKWRYLIITYKGLDEEDNEADFTLQRTVNADGTDDYNMSDNWLFRNLVWTAEQVGDYADAMVTKMQNNEWFPFEMWCAGLPYLETGDQIEIPLNGEVYKSYILQRQLKGIQNLQDTYINGTLDIF